MRTTQNSVIPAPPPENSGHIPAPQEPIHSNTPLALRPRSHLGTPTPPRALGIGRANEILQCALHSEQVASAPDAQSASESASASGEQTASPSPPPLSRHYLSAPLGAK